MAPPAPGSPKRAEMGSDPAAALPRTAGRQQALGRNGDTSYELHFCEALPEAVRQNQQEKNKAANVRCKWLQAALAPMPAEGICSMPLSQQLP